MVRKEIDLSRVEIGSPQDSIAKAIREKKRKKDFDGAEKLWKNDQNKPNRIRKRIKDYFEKIDTAIKEFYPKEIQEEFKKIELISSEEAKEEIKKYNKIIIPTKGKKELNFNNLEDVNEYIMYGQKGEERIKFLFLFSKAYPESINHLFSVNGEGKTNLDKIINKRR